LATRFFAEFQVFPKAKNLKEIFAVETNEKNWQQIAKKNKIPVKSFRKNFLKQQKYNQDFFNFGKKIARFFKFLPGISGLAICNSVALQTSKKNSDIDFFIFCQNGKIWTARFFAVLFLQIFGWRRNKKKITKKICLSFFVVENFLDFKKISIKPKDPYLAFWILSLKPVFGKKILEKFWKKNINFVQKNLGFMPEIEEILQINCFEKKEKTFITKKFLEFIFFWLEKILKFFCYKRANKKRKLLKNSEGIIISDKILKFHDKDIRRKISKNIFFKNLKQS